MGEDDGVKEAGKPEPVRLGTLFQAGSISKPVTALAALHYVEQGRFSLDEDINRKLRSWHVPDNEFTRTEKVTLRRLLSHSAGLTVHGFPGYATTEAVPTIVQVLDGPTQATHERPSSVRRGATACAPAGGNHARRRRRAVG